jgi:hypothetical protein
MPGNILEKAPSEAGAELFDNSLDIGPKVPFVVFAFSLSSLRERLAWVSGEKCVEGSGKGSCVKCGDVVPDWGRGEVSGALGVCEDLARELFPLDKASGVKLWLCEHEAQIKASASCAEGQSVSGR